MSILSDDGVYTLLVTGAPQFAATALTVGSDVNQPGNIGSRIMIDASNNAFFDVTSDALRFRMSDGNGALQEVVQVQYDDGESTASNNALNVNGRIAASQYTINTADTRVPGPGLGMYIDSNQVGYLTTNVSEGGTGGFVLSTINGEQTTTNLRLTSDGSVQAPYYSATENSNDTEAVALAGFDADGNLVRSTGTNERIRTIESNESRMTDKLNALLRRVNSYSFTADQLSPFMLMTYNPWSNVQKYFFWKYFLNPIYFGDVDHWLKKIFLVRYLKN